MDTEALPRYDPDLGRYVWETPPPPNDEVAVMEPAFVREAVEADFAPVDKRQQPVVTTFADAYPHGALTANDSATSAPEFDPLADWRVPGEVADSILVALPEGTPRMLRTLLTLLLGGMRRGGSEHP